jgi:CxxC-x17-CxxC domain-containing protein
MKNTYRDRDSKGAGGWKGKKPFGPKRAWERGSDGRSGGKSFLHQAVCSTCGKACEVPFKPTGRKPVFCSNCFKRDGGDAAPGRYGDKRARPSFDRGSERGASTDTSGIEARLKAIEARLDGILEMLQEK